MNTLEQVVAEILQKALAAAETATEFVLNQLPDVARQYIMWRIAEGLMWVVFCLLTTAVVHKVAKHFSKATDGFSYPLLWVPWTIFVLPAFCINTTQALKAYVAPKIVLIEWAGELAEKATKKVSK